MYQSLHTTVITNYGVPFEIQIRTEEMHKIAEYGIAAHWKYKEGADTDPRLDEKLRWVKEVLAYEPDIKDSKEFLDLIKKDISINEEIYVFTPKGDVRALNANATALDFAYLIHSEVGNHCVGTKVNGKIVPLDKTLKTGDVVEVLTNPSSKGPSRDWLKIVKTSSAKAKIRQFFKRELKEEHIKTGKQILERDAKHRGFTLSQLITKEALEALFERYSFTNSDEMYASVGYGGITATQVLTKLIGKSKQMGVIAEPDIAKRKPSSAKENAVIVKGNSDLLVRFSGCCSPVPGDDIIGYISRGRGVCIHRADCKSVKAFEKERLVEAEWALMQTTPAFPADIQIVAEDKGEVFADITRVVSNEKLPLLAINARKDKNKNAVATITVEITSHNQVNQLIAKLQSLPATIKVFRTTK